jgi:hypothetical protein
MMYQSQKYNTVISQIQWKKNNQYFYFVSFAVILKTNKINILVLYETNYTVIRHSIGTNNY